MEFGLSEQDRAMAASVRSLLAARSPRNRVRDVVSGTDAGDAVFADLAAAGWLATAVTEERGGLGLGVLQLAVVAREAAAALLPEPLTSAMLAATLLAASGYEEDGLLDDVLAGTVRLALVHHAAGQPWVAAELHAPGEAGVEAEPDVLGVQEENGMLDGAVDIALDVDRAELLLVPARSASGDVSWWLLSRDGLGVAVQRGEAMDPLAHLCRVEFRGARGRAVSGGRRLLTFASQLGALLMAAELVGLAEQAVRTTVEFTAQRHQFGKPIGSFQALKHGLAESHTLTHMATNAVWYAADALDQDRPDRQRAVSVAKAAAGDAARMATAQMVQFHGGVGFTWEHDAQLFFKRAVWAELLFGDSAEHRDHLVSRAEAM